MSSISQILDSKSSQVWSIKPDATVYEAVTIMSDKNIGALLVIENRKLCGIISERDVTRSAALNKKSAQDTPVAEIMTKKVYTAHPGDNINDCMVLMTNKRCRHLPVIEINTLEVLGMISIGDLVKNIIEEQKFVIGQVESYIAS